MLCVTFLRAIRIARQVIEIPVTITVYKYSVFVFADSASAFACAILDEDCTRSEASNANTGTLQTVADSRDGECLRMRFVSFPGLNYQKPLD